MKLNNKIVEVFHGDHDDGSAFYFYRGNGDLLVDMDQLPEWASHVVQVNINEFNSYWSTALPPEALGAKLAATRIDVRDLNLLVIDPQSIVADGESEMQLMEQEADIAYRMKKLQEYLNMDLSINEEDLAASRVNVPGWNTVAEAEIDTSYLDNQGNGEETLREAEAQGFSQVADVSGEESRTATGS